MPVVAPATSPGSATTNLPGRSWEGVSALEAEGLGRADYGAAMAPNTAAGVGQRPISEEPMYLIVNLGISENFGAVEWVQC